MWPSSKHKVVILYQMFTHY